MSINLNVLISFVLTVIMAYFIWFDISLYRKGNKNMLLPIIVCIVAFVMGVAILVMSFFPIEICGFSMS